LDPSWEIDGTLSFNHLMMSENTISMFCLGSPEVKAWHIPGYSFNVLPLLFANVYSVSLTVGSVTASSPPWTMMNGRVTYSEWRHEHRNTNMHYCFNDRMQHTTSMQNLVLLTDGWYLIQWCKISCGHTWFNFHIYSKLFRIFLFIYNFAMVFHVQIKYVHV